MPIPTADLSGKTYGAWRVVDRAPTNGKGMTCWNCVCTCGTAGVVTANNLRTGTSTRCKACAIKLMAPREDLTGQRFGTRLVLGQSRGVNRRWRSVCDCGHERVLKAYELRSDLHSCSQCEPGPAVEINPSDWTGLRVNTLDVTGRGAMPRTWAVRCFCCGWTADVPHLALSDAEAVCKPCREAVLQRRAHQQPGKSL